MGMAIGWGMARNGVPQSQCRVAASPRRIWGGIRPWRGSRTASSACAEKKLYQRQIDATDQEIDALVYELYGLTEEEIAIVEGRDH